MALININTSTPQTTQEKQAVTSLRIRRKSIHLFNLMKNGYEQILKEAANNPEGLTQAQVINGLGADSTEMISFMANIKQALNALAPGTIP